MDPTASLGERKTHQRDAIAKVIRDARGPLSVDDILSRAKKHTGSLGIATVYRTVKLLSQAGQIHPVTLSDGQVRYEAADLGHHHHFHCRDCGRVFDLPGCPLKVLGGKITVPEGFVVQDHELTLLGRCAECAKSKPPREAKD